VAEGDVYVDLPSWSSAWLKTRRQGRQGVPMYGLGSLGLASKWYHSLGLIVRLREDSRGVMWTSSFKERFGFGPWWACVSRVTSYYCVCGWPNVSFLSLLLINFFKLVISTAY
jgi:hypothetical protein